MSISAFKLATSLVVTSAILMGCAGGAERREERREHRDATGQGAIGGAVLGATAGILLGDAELAVKGAAAGAVAGGVAGSMKDYDNDRYDRNRAYENSEENARNATMAEAVSSIGGKASAPEGWQNIDAFIGSWKVTGTSVVASGGTVDFTADGVSRLDSTQSVTFDLGNFNVSAGKSLVGNAKVTLDYDAKDGFRLSTNADGKPNVNNFVGYFDANTKQYVYFYAGGQSENFTGQPREDFKVVLKMVGSNVIIAETYAQAGLETKKIQTYRLTKQ